MKTKKRNTKEIFDKRSLTREYFVKGTLKKDYYQRNINQRIFNKGTAPKEKPKQTTSGTRTGHGWYSRNTHKHSNG